MDTQTAALVVLAALFVAWIHVSAPMLRERVVHTRHSAESLFGGLSAAYVFVVLLPELGEAQHRLGAHLYAVVLAGFVLLYGVEHGARWLDWATDSEAGRIALFWLRTTMLWLTTFLFVLTLPDHHHDQPTFFVMVVFGASLGFLVHNYHVYEDRPDLHRRVGRWVLASSPLAGAAIDLFLEPPGEVVQDLLIAVVAGFVLLKAMLSREYEHSRTQFVPFALGALIYGAVFLSQPLHPAS